MYVCELEFEQPDPDNPDYSMTEIDYYSHIPPQPDQTQTHRLSMRKNLKTGEYELYRQYGHTIVRSSRGTTMITDEETEKIEIAFHHKDIREAMRFANAEVMRFWHHETNDELCTHEYPKKSLVCPNLSSVRIRTVGKS